MDNKKLHGISLTSFSRPAAEVRREVARLFGSPREETGVQSSGGGVGSVKKTIQREPSLVSEWLKERMFM